MDFRLLDELELFENFGILAVMRKFVVRHRHAVHERHVTAALNEDVMTRVESVWSASGTGSKISFMRPIRYFSSVMSVGGCASTFGFGLRGLSGGMLKYPRKLP